MRASPVWCTSAVDFSKQTSHTCVCWSRRACERVSHCNVEGRTVTGSECVSVFPSLQHFLCHSSSLSSASSRVFSLSRLLFLLRCLSLDLFLLSSCNVPLVSSSHTGFLSASLITLTLTLYNLCVTPLCSSSSYLIFHDTRHASEWSVKNMNFHSRIQTKLFRMLFHKDPS